MQSLFFFIIALSILVVIHEYGHYWVARRCGVKVLRFSVGFGKPLWSRMGKNGTEFVIAALPLGGYVKMLDERDESVSEQDKHHSFNRKTLRQRVAIVAAGPIANLLFAILAYWLMFVVGIPGLKPLVGDVVPESIAHQAQFEVGEQIVSVNGRQTATWNSVYQRLMLHAEQGDTVLLEVSQHGQVIERSLSLPRLSMDDAPKILSEIGLQPVRPDLPSVIGEVMPNSRAEQAGLRAGDELLTAQGRAITVWHDWVKFIQNHPGQSFEITYLRGGDVLTSTLTPEADAENIGRIGVAVKTTEIEMPDELKAIQRFGLLSAFPAAVEQTWTFSVTMLKGIAGMLVGQVSTDNLGGPLSIAQFAGSSAQQGVITFISFLAMISISLGILNLLPIPMLDGGHLLMYLIEWIKGSPVSETIQATSQKIGLIVLLSLMFFAFTNDLIRLFG